MKKIIEKFKEFDWTIEAQLTFLNKSMFPLPLIFAFHYFNRTSLSNQLISHITTWSLYKHFASIAIMFLLYRS